MKTVKIKQGVLKGIEKKSLFSNKVYYSFLNIPYAKPPVGDLRFQPPRPHEGWSGIRDATKFGNIAPQKKLFPSPQKADDEDCLFLHVHVPEASNDEDKSLKPVMVFIHGGGFTHGSCGPAMFGPDFLMEKDVILVAMNYRLGVLGFLNLGLSECPGNMGLKDQVLAFEWIKDNIKEFGGNPENITAFGESAGASSVHYHIISPKGKGLFNRAILQSGTALNYWAFSRVTVEASLRLGNELGFNINDRPALIRSLKTVSLDDLFKAASSINKQMIKFGSTRMTSFLPSKEILEDESEMYLPDEPEVLIQSAPSIPIISGLSEKEGLLMFLNNDMETFIQIFNDYHIVPMEMNTFDQPLIPISKEIKNYYFNGRGFCEDKFPEIVDYFTDVFFTIGFNRSINCATQSRCPTYVYLFTREDAVNYRKIMFSALVPHINGTTHGDELAYIFLPHRFLDNLIPQDAYNASVLETVDEITSYWTNFAKTGNPNGEHTKIEWLPHLSDKPRHLRIDRCSEMNEGRLFGDRLRFWETVSEKIAQKWYQNNKCRL